MGKDREFFRILVAIRCYFNGAKAASDILEIKEVSSREEKNISLVVPERRLCLTPISRSWKCPRLS